MIFFVPKYCFNLIISIITIPIALLFYSFNLMGIKETYIMILRKHNDIIPPIVPPILLEFIVLGEDRKYFYHFGIDPIAIIRAIFANFRGELQGASTITQQYIRILSRNYEMTYKRKIKEIFLALLLNSKFEKIDVIQKYLAIAYYGYNMEGINDVCKKIITY